MKYIGIFIIFILIPFFGLPNEKEMNSFMGIKIGMLKNKVIFVLDSLNIDYNVYDNKITFEYEIIKDDIENNMIKVLFFEDRVNQIDIYFYAYHLSDGILGYNNERFNLFLEKIDDVYDNDINWKGKWKSKDKTIIVETLKKSIQGKVYDVLSIREKNKIKKDNKKINKEDIVL
jgi:hypothetical protein